MLGNLDQAFRSRLEAINLIALFNCDLISAHGYSLDDVLYPFINDLKQLNDVGSNYCEDACNLIYSYTCMYCS